MDALQSNFLIKIIENGVFIGFGVCPCLYHNSDQSRPDGIEEANSEEGVQTFYLINSYIIQNIIVKVICVMRRLSSNINHSKMFTPETT